MDACWNYWICVPGGDQPGIMRILGLSNPWPATYALAESVLLGTTHGDRAGRGLVFITPEINGAMRRACRRVNGKQRE